eukprot:176192-Rhodomonas_salina.3
MEIECPPCPPLALKQPRDFGTVCPSLRRLGRPCLHAYLQSGPATRHAHLEHRRRIHTIPHSRIAHATLVNRAPGQGNLPLCSDHDSSRIMVRLGLSHSA